jgi:PilZ domain
VQNPTKKKIRGTESGVWALPFSRTQPTNSSQANERRTYVRHFCDIGAVVDAWPARIQDISRGGAKVVLSRRYEVGTVLKLEVFVPSNESLYMLLVKVVHIVQEPTGSWRLGCAFVQEITDEEMQELLTTSEAPTAANGTK